MAQPVDDHKAPGELINYLSNLYKGFDPSTETIEAYSEMYFETHNVPNKDDMDFLREIIHGCTRFQPLLNAVVIPFLERSAISLKSDSGLYLVISYMALLAIEELSFDNLRIFILTQKAMKMASLLKYIYDPENFEKIFKVQWCRNYDASFVMEIYDRMMKYESAFLELIEELDQRVNGKMALTKTSSSSQMKGAQSTSRKAHSTKPFKLTSPKPRKVEAPKVFSTSFMANPIPETHYTGPKKIEKKEKIIDPAPFNLSTPPKPEKLQKIKEDILKERQQQLQFDKKHAIPMPQYPDNANVRLNVAAVLREEKVFRKKQEEEAKILKQYEQDLRDSSEFEDWKQKGREKDEEDLRQKIEKTKEEIAQLSLEAQKAKILNVAKNQLAAAELQGDIASKLHEKREADEEEKERLMRQAEELNIETKNAVDEAKRLLAEKKKENAEQMAAEKAQRAKEVAEQKAIEDAKRREIILQIKALERIPQTEGRYQQFDPTTTPGYGLMDEMSLIELRDRLVMLQERELREREERRKGILAQKAEKDEEMAARVDFIAKLRQKSNIEAKGRRDKEAQLAEERRQRELKKHNDNAEKMHSKLTSKKDDKIKELERLESEARAIRERNKLLADDKSAQEMRQFSQLQKGAERAAKNRIDQKRMQEAKDKEVRSRIDRDRRQENERKEIQLDSDVHTMKSKLASEKARLEALRQQQFNDLHIKAAVDRAMARLSKIEADERNPQVAIEHILQEDSAYMDESEFI